MRYVTTNSSPIMTWENWPKQFKKVSQLVLKGYRDGFLHGDTAKEYIKNSLKRHSPPEAFFALSDGDIAWWTYHSFAKFLEKEGWTDCIPWWQALAYSSGLHESDRGSFYTIFNQACIESKHWLLQYNWDIAETITYLALQEHLQRSLTEHKFVKNDNEIKSHSDIYRIQIGASVDQEYVVYVTPEPTHIRRFTTKLDTVTKVDCNVVYTFTLKELKDIIDNRKLAIVSNHSLLPSLFNNVVTYVHCPAVRFQKAPYIDNILKNLGYDSDWEFLLCSAGALSTPLCHIAKKTGKHALDIGSLDEKLIAKHYKKPTL